MKRRGRPPHPDVLTPREWEVMDLLRRGQRNRQIASRLGISLAGAKFHVSEILGKLGLRNRREAAAWQPAPAGRGWAAGLVAIPLGLIRKMHVGWLPAAGAAALFLALAAGAGLFALGVARTRGGDDDNQQMAAPLNDQGPYLVYVELQGLNPLASALYVSAVGGQPQQLVRYDDSMLFYLAGSPDGRLIAALEQPLPEGLAQGSTIDANSLAPGNVLVLDRAGRDVFRRDGQADAILDFMMPLMSWAPDSNRLAFMRVNRPLLTEWSSGSINGTPVPPPTATPLPEGVDPPAWTELVDVAGGRTITPDRLKSSSLVSASWTSSGRLVAMLPSPDFSAASFVELDAGGLAEGRPPSEIKVEPPGVLPLVSPDGRWIAYWVADQSDASGGIEPALLLATPGEPRAFPTSVPPRNMIYVAPEEGGQGRPLAEADPLAPGAWSPDGTQLVLACGGNWSTSTGSGSADTEPEAQPTETVVEHGADICIVNVVSGATTYLTRDDVPDYRPAFSPDGRYVAFASGHMNSEALPELKVVDVRTGEVRTVARNAWPGAFTWLPGR